MYRNPLHRQREIRRSRKTGRPIPRAGVPWHSKGLPGQDEGIPPGDSGVLPDDPGRLSIARGVPGFRKGFPARVPGVPRYGRGRLSGLTGSARRLLEAGVESIEGLFHPADVFRARAGVRGLGVGFGELAEGHQPVVQRVMSLALHRAA